jgi:uncharacterized surface anchored protein
MRIDKRLLAVLPLVLTAGCLGFLEPSYRYGTVHVTVADSAGAPVAGAGVQLYNPAGVVDGAVTGPNGEALFELVPRGAYGVRVAAPDGYLAAPGGSYVDGLAIGEGTRAEARVVLAADCCAAIHVQTVDSLGAALPGVTVSAYTSSAVAGTLATGADGRAVFSGLRSGGYGVRAIAPTGYAVPAGGRDYVDGITLLPRRDTAVTIRFAKR